MPVYDYDEEKQNNPSNGVVSNFLQMACKYAKKDTDPEVCRSPESNNLTQTLTCILKDDDGNDLSAPIPLKYCQESAETIQVDQGKIREKEYSGATNMWEYLTKKESEAAIDLSKSNSYSSNKRCHIIKEEYLCQGSLRFQTEPP